jgi:cephalosporin hydroxylase
MEHTFSLSGVNFKFTTDYQAKSSIGEVVLLKPKHILDYYSSLIPNDRDVWIFEIGVFEAGSALALAAMHPNVHVVGIDFTNKPHLDELIKSLGFDNRVHIFHNVDQKDEKKVLDIISRSFKSYPIDLVIDDGSHMYLESKESFEVVFPLVKDGGFYVIEDWNWAHYSGDYQSSKWNDKPALTNLVFELIMMHGTDNSLIRDIFIRDISCVVRRGAGNIEGSRLDLASLTLKRQRDLILL